MQSQCFLSLPKKKWVLSLLTKEKVTVLSRQLGFSLYDSCSSMLILLIHICRYIVFCCHVQQLLLSCCYAAGTRLTQYYQLSTDSSAVVKVSIIYGDITFGADYSVILTPENTGCTWLS